MQRTQYYPSGLPWQSNSGDYPGSQPYKYGGKEFVEMHGLDEYDSDARWYSPAIMRTTTPDPLAEKYYDISPYAWCANNPVRFVDPNGMWIESVWDAYSLVTGAKSFVNNVEQGNVGAAIVDGFGVFADGAAILLPGIPGGVGAGIKALRAEDKVVDAVRAADKVGDAGKAGKTIVKENGVTVKSYGTNDVHKPAHAHVKGGGKEVGVGSNGKPLKGQPELSDKQRKVVENNKKDIRKEVNAVGKENKKIEDQKQRK